MSEQSNKKSETKAKIVKIGEPQEIQSADFWFPIDWNKVKSVNDVKVILSNMGLGCRQSAPGYEILKKYLSDTPQEIV